MLFELTTLVVIDTDCNYHTITTTTVLCSHSKIRKTCINLLIGIQILLTYAILVRIYIYQYLDEMLGCERDIFFTIDNCENTIKYSLSYFSEVFYPSGAPVASPPPPPPWFLVGFVLLDV